MNGVSPSKYVPSSPICTDPFSSKYTIEEDIGRGKFAVVRKCVEKATGDVVAAKVIRKRRKGKSCREEILREVVMLELAMAHPRLVSLKEVFETQSELILVTEYCSGGELFHECVIKESFKEDDVRKLLIQILEGLAYLHDNNIVHLDLKPQNILLTQPFPDGDVKICDLGFACLTNTGEDIRDIIGTPDYVAPEVLDYEPLNIQTDMWSLGVLTYVMLTTCSPFAGDTQQETFCNITQAKLDFPDDLFGHINPLAQDFISKLLVKKPRDRLTARQCLEHPWLSDLSRDMAISVPMPDHSEELAHDMVVPSNWHLTADRRTSLTLSTGDSSNVASLRDVPEMREEETESESDQQGDNLSLSTSDMDGLICEERSKRNVSLEKDSISNVLSSIGIDNGRTDRSSSTSFDTCIDDSASSNPSSSFASCIAEFKSRPNGEQTESSQTLIAYANEVVDSLTNRIVGENASGNLQSKALNGDLSSDSSSVVSRTEENLQNLAEGDTSNTTKQEPCPAAVLNSSNPRDSNKVEYNKKRMSMEIPPKRAKCIQEEDEEVARGPQIVQTNGEGPAVSTDSESTSCRLEQSANQSSDAMSSSPSVVSSCNGVDDYRNAV